MGNVIKLSEAGPKQSSGAASPDALALRFDSIIQAIDVQKAEIAAFRTRMEKLRAEMKSLDSSVSLYRQRVADIPHRQLHHQARRLQMLGADGPSHPA